MREASFNMLCFKSLCVLSLVLISQTQTPLLQCPPDTNVEKRNVMAETPITLPPAMNYQYSNPALFGTDQLELTVRLEGQKLFLSVLRYDWRVYEQSKTYATPVKIVGVRNKYVLVQIFSADKSSFTYEAIEFDYDITTAGESPVNTGKVKALTGIPVGGEIKEIIYYAHEGDLMYVLISTGTTGAMYYIHLIPGVVQVVRSFETSIIPKYMGSSFFFWQSTTKKFYNAADPDVHKQQDITAELTAANAAWYPTTVQVHTILFHDTVFLSTDAASKKGTLINQGHYKTPTFAIYNVGGGAVLPRISSDNLLSFIVYSDKQLIWFSYIAWGGLDKTKYYFINKKVGEGIDQAIADFSSALTVSLSLQKAFLMTPKGLKFYQIYDLGGVLVSKIGETIFPESVTESLGASGKLIALTVKCECATDSAPKLVCFASTLNCLMVTRKVFTDCTYID